jgi:hypothetical protein
MASTNGFTIRLAYIGLNGLAAGYFFLFHGGLALSIVGC